MKFFYDFEFQDNGSTIEPISLGVVSENSKEIYFVNTDFEENTASEWLRVNVLPKLYAASPSSGIIHEYRPSKWGEILYSWLAEINALEKNTKEWKFVGYYADYDHVALAQLYGDMMSLPIGMPMWTQDIKQWIDDLGNPEIPLECLPEHNALVDARWNRGAYNYLTQNFNHPAWGK